MKYFQKHQGLDVLGGEISVRMNRAGQVMYVKTKVATDLPGDTTPRFVEGAARDAALRAAMVEAPGGGPLTVLSARLLVLPLGIIKNYVGIEAADA